MKDIFTQEEFEQVKVTLNDSLACAESAFSSITRKKTTVKTSKIELMDIVDLYEVSTHMRDYKYAAITDIIGEYSGKSYFLLCEKDANTLFSLCLGKNSDNEELRIAMLKEFDNIIAASVITQFANTLHAEIYGDVPRFENNIKEKISRMLYKDAVSDQKISGHDGESLFALTCSTFSLEGIDNFRAKFIWILPIEFTESLVRIPALKS